MSCLPTHCIALGWFILPDECLPSSTWSQAYERFHIGWKGKTGSQAGAGAGAHSISTNFNSDFEVLSDSIQHVCWYCEWKFPLRQPNFSSSANLLPPVSGKPAVIICQPRAPQSVSTGKLNASWIVLSTSTFWAQMISEFHHHESSCTLILWYYKKQPATHALPLAPAEGFGLRPRFLLAFGQKKSFFFSFGLH